MMTITAVLAQNRVVLEKNNLNYKYMKSLSLHTSKTG